MSPYLAAWIFWIMMFFAIELPAVSWTAISLG